jgi:hypothetical protein
MGPLWLAPDQGQRGISFNQLSSECKCAHELAAAHRFAKSLPSVEPFDGPSLAGMQHRPATSNGLTMLPEIAMVVGFCPGDPTSRPKVPRIS